MVQGQKYIISKKPIYFCDNRNLYLNFNSKTKQCLGISIDIKAFNFKRIKYALTDCEAVKLLYEDISSKDFSIYNGYNLKLFFDEESNLILIGNPFSTKAPIQFFGETYGVIDNGKLELLIIRVENEIIKSLPFTNLLV